MFNYIFMIDVEFLRNNTALVKQVIQSGRSNSEKANIDLWVKLDKERKEKLQAIEELNREKNKLAERGKSGNVEGLKEEGRRLKEQGQVLEQEIKEITKQWQEILDWVPNMPLDEVPQGLTSDDNVEFKAWTPETGYFDKDKLSKAEGSGEHMSKFAVNSTKDFEPKPHWEIATKLDILDLEAGAKVSGSRFYYIKKEGALLVFGFFQLLMKKLIRDGFDPMIVPLLVKDKALYGSSHFPGDADQVYKLENNYLEDENSLYLIGSSEPSNFAYFMDKVLTADELPIKVMAQTACFRSEVGSWGKDVRGMKRTHQFDKLEMNVVMEADLDKAREMHEYLLSLNEWLLQELKLPYHVINMCYGDLGYYAAAKKYDVEVWLPSQKAYMEVMSDSITTDYQARRLNIKYKDSEGKSKFAYTLNDTGATHRLLIAIIEHYQQKDGSIKVPDALVDYVGKDTIGKN